MSEFEKKVAKSVNRQLNRIDATNALRIVRPTLGDQAGIGLYRLLRLVALEDIIGRGAGATAYVAGTKVGQSLALTSLDDFLELCNSLAIGVIRVPILTDTKVYVDVYECVTCAGMERVGRTLCHFEAGLISGCLTTILGKKCKAKEMTCIGGLGDESCGVEVLVGGV